MLSLHELTRRLATTSQENGAALRRCRLLEGIVVTVTVTVHACSSAKSGRVKHKSACVGVVTDPQLGHATTQDPENGDLCGRGERQRADYGCAVRERSPDGSSGMFPTVSRPLLDHYWHLLIVDSATGNHATRLSAAETSFSFAVARSLLSARKPRACVFIPKRDVPLRCG